MSSLSFRVDLRDIRFVLFEQLDIDEELRTYAAYADFDKDVYESLLDEAERVAREDVAPTNKAGDRVGATFDGKGNVATAPGFKEAWNAVAAGGWMNLLASPEVGGTGAPHVVGTAVNEIMQCANVSLAIYTGLTVGAANLLWEFADEPTRSLVCRKMYAGEWAGTMCLTEAGAGSAVGDNRARATPTGEPGVYLLEGEKVFISGGDHDLAKNIVHLVLARTPDAPAGTKGLSIFLVPKFHFDADGNLGERNGAFVTGIEEKMGIHGSATCTLVLGADQPCKGWLLGKEGEGMAIMFHMMNEARIGVGIQGMSGAATAYQYALAYAKERIQGTPVTERDADAARVAIVEHPDVRRMLMTMKCQVEAMRSLLYTVAHRLDRSTQKTDAKEKEYLLGLVELMTPICKAHCSDVGFELCTLGVQIFGGYGYIGEYPIEQVLRDNKISSIYEGTNGIQAMDLLGRKMRKNGGQLFMSWLQECNEELERCKAAGVLPAEVAALEKARDMLGATAMHLGGLGMQGKIADAMLHASPFLRQFGTVVLGLHSLWQARVAKGLLDKGGLSESDAAFYRSKLLNTRFYVANILPAATALGKAIQTADNTPLDADCFV